MMGAILAVLEQRAGKVRRVSLEVLTAARKLADATGTGVDAVLIGASGGGDLGTFGADRVFTVGDDRLALYQGAAYAAIVVERMKSGGYSTVVLGATTLGRDLAPRIAARLAVPLLADVTAMDHQDGLVVSRPVYSGKALYRLKVTAPACVISVRPNVFTPVESRKAGTVTAITAPTDADDPRQRTVRIKEPERAALDVSEAAVVVSGGRGLRDPASFKMLEELAAAFGNAAVGASRAVVDAGWRPHGEQVGQTGKTVSPSLYIAVGISGAIQHLAGMRTAKVIVAINKDKDAPIFKIADYGILGDLFEIVPKLTEEIKRIRAS
ncbi:MAG: electron transfer flavoprotein subunit alpha/FixB family protein [Gemmatimonadetes bacterium]|nr:electron transfer flavoprotein subunit alpha/FixB family protein [Gemmatimonadota bacterium]